MTSERVLLVDDEEEFIATLSKRLKARGLAVDTAANGEAAIERVEAREFDVILLDLAMPGIDGIETLRRIREVNPDVQVILLTGHGSVPKSVEAMKLGAADFLQKPADFQQLLETIREAGEKRAILVEQRTTEHVADIIEKMGW